MSKGSKLEAQEAAVRFLAPLHFHQSTYLPETTSHSRLRVTFATTSNYEDASLPAILFAGPMFGTRYFIARMDKIANEAGVRVIGVERPGFGGSTPVPIQQRLPVWIESVPLVLQKLKIPHVSLVSHSAGTIYLMNTLGQLRHLVDPEVPYVAFLGPWVHCDHSQETLWKVAASLPNAVFSAWGGLNVFINTRIAPVSAWSGGVFSSAMSLFQANPTASDSGDTDVEDMYDVPPAVAHVLSDLGTKYAVEEGVSGANDEARMCLKKGGPGLWGVCEDYPTFIASLCEEEKKRLEENSEAKKLQIRVAFADSDMMIGEGGRKYFREVWCDKAHEKVIDVKTEEYPETNHETVLLDYKKGALVKIFEEIAALHK